MRVRCAIVLLAACGSAATLHPVVAPVVPRPTFAIAPEQLGVPGALAKLPYRTRLAGYGRGRERMTVRAHGEPSELPQQELGWHHYDPGDGAGRVLQVIGTSPTMIRVVEDNDHARFALWIVRDDAMPAVTAPIQLADIDGLAPIDTGVWLQPGAPVELGRVVKALREVTVLDEALDLRGYVAATLIDHVWRDTPAPASPSGATVRLPGDTILRTAPGGAPIARVTDHAIASVVEQGDGATLVEVQRPFARVRGWVAGALQPAPLEPAPATPGPPKLEYAAPGGDMKVPAGACFYDSREGGEVIGVQLEAENRWGAMAGASSGTWNIIYIESTWARFDAYLNVVGGSFDAPEWETCPRTRRHVPVSFP